MTIAPPPPVAPPTVTLDKVQQYTYRARRPDGEVVKGKARATSEGVVLAELASKGFIPLEVRNVSEGLQREINFNITTPKPKPKALALMARQLATSLAAGTTMMQALDILVAQTEDKPLLDALKIVHRDVNDGIQLSAAMGEHPKVFPAMMVNMVRAGEASGKIPQTMDQVANNLERETNLRRQVKSAMTYPLVVGFIAIVAVTAMLIFVVPTFAELYQDFGDGNVELPLVTRFTIALSTIVKWSIIPFIIAVVAFTFWFKSNKDKPSVREPLDRLKVRLPVFGELSRKLALTRFCRNFAQLLESGVVMDRALEIVADTVGNWQMKESILRAREGVRTGRQLAPQLAVEPLFDPMVIQMLTVGEKNGKIDTMLRRTADHYDAEVEATTSALKSLLEPIMIVFVGGAVGFIAVAIYAPYFSMGDLLGGGQQS